MLQTTKWVGAFSFIFLLACSMQCVMLPNSDIGWLTLASSRLLAGGTYAKDFFEINPPLILYLYFPAVILSHILSISIFTAVQFYVFTLILFSLSICFELIKNIFKNDSSLAFIFFIALCTIFLLLPASEFGQREHLLIILALPYFLLSANEHRYPAKFNFLIGLLAGLGFAIKPYFLISFFFVEIYLCCQKRNWREIFRSETVAIFAVGLSYLFIILTLHHDYLTAILPWVMSSYYQKFHTNLTELMFGNMALFCYFIAGFYFLMYQNNTYKRLGNVLFAAAVGFLFSYFLQRNHWYYHFLPAFSANILLSVLLFSQLVRQNAISQKQYLKLVFYSMAVIFCLYFEMYYIFISIQLFPIFFFSLFFALFCLIFYLTMKNGNISLFVSTVILVIGVSFYTQTQHTIWRSHEFLLTTLLLILLFLWIIPDRNFQIKIRYALISLVGILLFAIPFYLVGDVFNTNIAYKEYYQNYLKQMQPFSKHSVIFFTDSCEFVFPAVNYLNQQFSSRMCGLMWRPSIENLPAKFIYHSDDKIINFFAEQIAEDIQKYKPEFIFIDKRRRKNSLGYFGNEQGDYIKLLSISSQFQTEWKNYHYLKNLDGQPLFRFDVYQRL